MCPRYARAVQNLARVKNGWHFGAARATPAQVRDFRLEDLARSLRSMEPELWTLIFRTVVVISIFMHAVDQQCNALQSVTGIFLHSCNAPEKLIKVLARMGLSISLTSMHRAIDSLSRQSHIEVETLGRTLLSSHAFDNFDAQINTLVSTVDKPNEGLLHLTSGTLLRLQQASLEDLRCSKLIWERSERNIDAPDPLASLRVLLPYLRDPEPVESIPISRLHQTPLRAMDINQSTVSGNIEAVLNIFDQAGLGNPRDHTDGSRVNPEEFVVLVHGDLGTCERVTSGLHRRSQERTPYDRLQSVVFVPGLFHLKMAAADAIWRLLVSPDGARSDDTSFMKLAGELRPNESSKLVNNAKFRQQHELINHVGTILQLDAWRVEIKKQFGHSSLDDWAATKPKLADIQAVADVLARDYVEGEGMNLYAARRREEEVRDRIQENTTRTLNYLLLYEELAYAMNAGDIGRIETVLPAWIQMFRAAGKHKYSHQMLRFWHALYFIYPEGLRRVIRMNILVNPSGKAMEFRAVDWVVELLNLYIKVIYGGEGPNYTKRRILLESIIVLLLRASHANFERNFRLPGLTYAHAKKDMRQTFKDMLARLEKRQPNERVNGRKGTGYTIGDALSEGAATLAREWSKPRQGRTGEGAREQEVTGDGDSEGEDLDEDAVELTEEDLSIDGMLA
ncbi:hypothetical protein LXA43DRAFT_908048 [Ganoderma leucocontextum]|nr:hypothetical protein LXA43DRAFT_908048 [Ganoderma leucocontextum]